ncbi:hypothetical protein ABK040_013593 [Willaertia magna]
MNNTIFACGNVKEGCLGKDFTEENYSTNTPYQKIQLSFPQSPTNTSIKEIYCGDYTTFFLLENGQVYASGNNESHQLGVGNGKEVDKNVVFEPELVQILNDKIIEVAPGASRTWFIGESGSFYLAGSNYEKNYLQFENNENNESKIRIISPTTQQPYLRQGEIIKHIYSFGDNIIITKYDNLYHLYTINDNSNNPLQLEFSFSFQIKKFLMGHSYGRGFAILFEENNLCLLKEENSLYLIENVIDISVGYGHDLICVKYFCKEDNCFKQKLFGCGTNLDGQVCPKYISTTTYLEGSNLELNLTKVLQNKNDQDKFNLLQKELNLNNNSNKTFTFLAEFTLYSSLRFIYLIDFNAFVTFEGTNLANEWVENIVSVACGGWHSGFVTKYGQVFGFGYNENYQIGNEENKDKGTCEAVFFKEELMKYDNEYIPQIRCGNRSTIVFLKKIGKGRENHFLFLQKITKNNELCDVDFFANDKSYW